jgi:hypothetical protein
MLHFLLLKMEIVPLTFTLNNFTAIGLVTLEEVPLSKDFINASEEVPFTVGHRMGPLVANLDLEEVHSNLMEEVEALYS